MQNLIASRDAKTELKKVTYPGQLPNLILYREGYEHFMDNMPKLEDNNEFLGEHIDYSRLVMRALSGKIKRDGWIKDLRPDPKGFNRTIVAMEPTSVMKDGSFHEGIELLVASWGDGKKSPVHGHSVGLLHEEVLEGRIRVNTYRITDMEKKIVRPIESLVVEEGIFVSEYVKDNPANMYKRQTLVHNFESIGQATTLHYVPEHTRDGRDNGFTVEYFEDTNLLDVDSVRRINSLEAMYLPKGEVVLVRSENVPEYSDHFIVITGAPIQKEHGLRPKETTVMTSPNGYQLLDLYEPITGLILLKLKPEMRDKFHAYHDIQIVDGKVIFPKP